MLICFLGDVHGRIFHALAVVAELQAKLGQRFGLIIQVGDLGFPNSERADESKKRYLSVDPAEADLERFLISVGTRAAALRDTRQLFTRPIHFVRGNHEDFEWLASLTIDSLTRTAPADPFDLLHFVPDGSVLDFGGYRAAFLGGVEEQSGAAAINGAAYESLIAMRPGEIDLLVTHEGPYGSSLGYHGDVHGSQMISTLLQGMQPRFHVFGHAHTLIGPEILDRTTYLGLDGLVASPLWHPEQRGLKPGCVAVVDMASGELWPVTDDWLTDFPTPFDFDAWYEDTRSRWE